MYRLFAPALLSALLISGCVVAPAPYDYDVVVAPALPAIVILDVEPYYHQHGYYYYYHDNNWSYSHDRAGPWRELPRDRYPRETKFRGRDKDHDDDRGRDGPGRYPGRDY